MHDTSDGYPNGWRNFLPEETVLHCACEKGNLEIVKKVLESENWNLREKMEVLNMVYPKKGFTPLELARKKKRSQVANVSLCLFSLGSSQTQESSVLIFLLFEQFIEEWEKKNAR